MAWASTMGKMTIDQRLISRAQCTLSGVVHSAFCRKVLTADTIPSFGYQLLDKDNDSAWMRMRTDLE